MRRVHPTRLAEPAMTVLITLLITAALLLVATLIFMLIQLMQRLEALEARLGSGPLSTVSSSPQRAHIAIEILNTTELALRETRFAGAAAKLAPRTIERIVYTRAADQIAVQLAEQGVRAQVKAHGV